jgi:hypothetical protein
MSYVVVKTIKGRRYRYLQTSWREGKRVRTKSVCLGGIDGAGGRPRAPLGPSSGGDFKRPRLEQRALAVAERHAKQIETEQREQFGETAAERSQRERQDHLDNLHERFGLTVGPGQPMSQDRSVGTTACAEAETSSSQAGAKADGGNTGSA